ncbi:MAG: HNH endonuclease [Pirellulaceae bacterium]
MDAFLYPLQSHHRRHGPRGYLDYESYRPWLRDEFEFRCVYCLRREKWDRPTALQVDHFVPSSLRPEGDADYENLFYACIHCNQAKGSKSIPNPAIILLSEYVSVHADGQIAGNTPEAQMLIDALRLNNSASIHFRRTWLDILALAQEFKPSLYRQLLGYPDALPDLALLRPPGGNSRPQGLTESHYARRQRNELPETY